MADGFKVTFTFDDAAVKARVEAACEKGIEAVALEAMKDCDKYTPAKSGTLKKSVLFGSDPKKGKLVWKMPYSRRQYYGIRFKFSKAMNAEAQAMWAHKGYAENHKKYEGILAHFVKKEV